MSDDSAWDDIPNPYDAMTNDTPESAMRSFVGAMERSPAPHTIVPKGGDTHMRFRAALARLSAERAAVSDEELLRVFEKAQRQSFEDAMDRAHHTLADTLAGIRAVRATLGTQVPAIPEGWLMVNVHTNDFDRYECVLAMRMPPWTKAHGTGPTWHEALTAAIAAAQDA